MPWRTAMNENQPNKSRFWPMLFLTAFLLAAALWAVWMYVLVQKSRRRPDTDFFVPRSNAPAAHDTNTPAVPTNVPPAP
jgi:Tfp pilus assembly protein PilN